MQQARRGGKSVYADRVRSDSRYQRRGKTPLDVLNHLMKCGDILDTEFDLDSAGTLDDEPSNTLLLDVLYATVLDGYSLSQILDVLPERIHQNRRDERRRGAENRGDALGQRQRSA